MIKVPVIKFSISLYWEVDLPKPAVHSDSVLLRNIYERVIKSKVHTSAISPTYSRDMIRLAGGSFRTRTTKPFLWSCALLLVPLTVFLLISSLKTQELIIGRRGRTNFIHSLYSLLGKRSVQKKSLFLKNNIQKDPPPSHWKEILPTPLIGSPFSSLKMVASFIVSNYTRAGRRHYIHDSRPPNERDGRGYPADLREPATESMAGLTRCNHRS